MFYRGDIVRFVECAYNMQPAGTRLGSIVDRYGIITQDVSTDSEYVEVKVGWRDNPWTAALDEIEKVEME